MANLSIEDLLKEKKKAKMEITKELNLSNKKPLLGIFIDNELDEEKEESLKVILEGLKDIDIDVVILADSNLDELGESAKILPYNRKNRSKLLRASDMALIFDFSDVEEILFNGVIPISCERPDIMDYDPNREQGYSFVYRKESPWSIFAALVRATETFKFPYDWKHIVRQGLSTIGERDV